jgi:hypothetical protein
VAYWAKRFLTFSHQPECFFYNRPANRQPDNILQDRIVAGNGDDDPLMLDEWELKPMWCRLKKQELEIK